MAAGIESVISQYGAQIVTVIGTIVGSVLLAAATRYLDRNKTQVTEDRNMRNELRQENDRQRDDIGDLREQMLLLVQEKQAAERLYIEYREKYIQIFEKYHTLRSEYERVSGHKLNPEG